MKFIKQAVGLLNKAYQPIKDNVSFFFFMYLLGILVSYAELPNNNPNATVYNNLWLELFLDVYLICVFLAFFPEKICRWIRTFFYIIAYSISLVDLFCWIKLQSTLNPSILLLVGETNEREASEFFSSYLTFDLVFSSIGLLLLIMFVHLLTIFWTRVKLSPAISYKIMVAKQIINHSHHILGGLCLVFLGWAIDSSLHNKKEMVQMFS